MEDKHRRYITLLICLFLILLTYVSFSRILNNKFINFDDNDYVIRNPHVNSGLTLEGIKWAFTAFHANNWHPITWLSHMVDCEIYGLNAGGHHFTNLILHIINTLLLFLVFKWITGAIWESAFIAALFAIHPLHVESVAWVAERKDVLSAFFGMLTIWAYARYAENLSLSRYLTALLCFIFGLMSKPMLVTLPFVLLLLDFWPLKRFQFLPADDESYFQTQRYSDKGFKRGTLLNLILEKIPFFIFVVVSSYLTFLAQQHGGVVKSLELFPLKVRIANALVAYIIYIKKMFYPLNLAILYPYPEIVPMWQALGAACLLVCIFILAIWKFKRYPYFTVGLLWYIGTLIPVIGLVQVGLQSMADRYTYMPLIGLFIIIAWGIPDIMSRFCYQKIVLAVLSVTIISTFMILTWIQTRHWYNSTTLLDHAIHVTKNNYLAYNGLGVAHIEQGRIIEGINNLYRAINIKHDFAEAHKNMGIALVKQRKIDEAIIHYKKALRISPESAIIHNSLGIALHKQGKIEESIKHFLEALEIWPNYIKAYNNLGIALVSQGKIQEALVHYVKALKINPDYAEAHCNMGIALEKLGKIEEAIAHYNQALRIKPDYPRARYNLEQLLSK
jgi:Flp pilus assembly protein TadD